MHETQLTNLKGYEIVERIGTGGFGAVYRAKQTTVNREVAIKFIIPSRANQPDFIRRFEMEAQLIARLEHPHITPLIDYWRDPQGAYLVMRYLRGGSVRDALKQSAYELDSVSRLLDQIAAALEFAHRHDVIHRDIKPENILLDEDGNAYLADFGIAKDLQLTEAQTSPDAVVGSLDYISPEQARSDVITPRTDIYSLGVMLYELITGEHPFKQVSAIERLYKHINDPLPLIESLPANVRDAINDIIQKATAKDPAHRYEDVLALAIAFRDGIGRGNTSQALSLIEQMTLREHEILQLIADGLTNQQIAEQLFITLSTVKWHVNQLYKKLGVRNRVQAIVRAREMNLIVTGDSEERVRDVSVTQLSLPEPENPYKGLHAFQSADARDFFGRSELVEKLIGNMRDDGRFSRFLAVIGPSGSGKSSLVKAGLIPALWKGALPGSEKWFVVEMLPGERPVDELEIALMRVAANHASHLHDQLIRDKHGLLRAAELILPKDDSELVVVVDQFEEVFTLVKDETVRQQFLNLLQAAVSEKRSRVRVVVTLRADYYDKPLHYPEFGAMLKAQMETVLPLSAKGLERAIVGPAERVGVTFEPGLVAQIVSETTYQAGALPLLQYALTELFERRQGRLLTHADYQEIGGAVGALAHRADEIYLSLPEAEQELTRQLFLRLVTLGEGAEDTRRRVERSELMAIATRLPAPLHHNGEGGTSATKGVIGTDMMEEILDTFASHRLLALDHDADTRHPTVEVAHEAILREWERLRQWLNDSRDDIRQERLIAQAAAAWQASNNDKSYLLTGTRLDQAVTWHEVTELALTPLESAFIRASVQEAKAQELDEVQRQAHEAALEQRARTVLRVLVAVFALAAIVSGGFGVFALNSRNAEVQARLDAEASEQEALRQASIGLAAIAEAELEGANPERGILLALEAVENFPYTPHAVGALTLAVEEYRPFRILDSRGSVGDMMTDATWSPDGSRVAASAPATPMSVVIWDVATGEELLSIERHQELCQAELEYFPEPDRQQSFAIVTRLAWSPSGDRIATIGQGAISGNDCGFVLIDSISGETLLLLSGYESTIWSLDWSPDGTTLLTGHQNGTATIWDAQTGSVVSTLTGHSHAVRDAVFSPDGRRIATASEDGTVVVWDAESNTDLMRLRGHAGTVRSLAWSPDSTRLVTGGNDDLPRIWDTTSGETLLVLSGHTDDVVEVEWAPDGDRIASQSLDFTVKLWNAATGDLLTEIRNAGPHWHLPLGYTAFSPDGKQLLIGASRLLGQVHVWDVSTATPRLFGHNRGQEWGNWSPDGTLIATSGMDNTARIWDATTGRQLRILDIAPSRWGAWSPDSTRLAIPGLTLTVVNVRSGEVLSGISSAVISADWSPDGSRIAVADFGIGRPAPVYILDAETHERLLTLPAEGICQQPWAAWSPDGTQIATTCSFVETGVNTPTWIWDAASGEQLITLTSEHGWSVRARWSPDGKRMLVTYDEGVARIWDVEAQEVRLTYAGHVGRVWTGAWSPDGTRIATTDVTSRQVKVWDAATGQDIVNFPIPGNAITIEWSPDGEHIIITGDGFNEPIIKRVFATPEELIAYAYECCVFRELTPEEREQFGLPQR